MEGKLAIANASIATSQEFAKDVAAAAATDDDHLADGLEGLEAIIWAMAFRTSVAALITIILLVVVGNSVAAPIARPSALEPAAASACARTRSPRGARRPHALFTATAKSAANAASDGTSAITFSERPEGKRTS